MSLNEILDIINDPIVFEGMMKDLFKIVDKDGSGTLDKYELRNLLSEFCKKIGIPFPKEDDINDLLMGFDTDGDVDVLNYPEFKDVVHRIIKQIVVILT